MDIQNPSRVLRALGESGCWSTLFFFLGQKTKAPFSVFPLSVNIPRSTDIRINDRVDEMINAGLLQEAESLYPYRDLNALRTVGYQEIFDFFDQKVDLDYTIELIKQNTRHYAKRQMTWIRSKEKNTIKIDPTISDEKLVNILTKNP